MDPIKRHKRHDRQDGNQSREPEPPLQPPAAEDPKIAVHAVAVPAVSEPVAEAPHGTSLPVSSTNDWCEGMKWDAMNLNQRIRYLTPRLQVNTDKLKVDESFYRAVFPTVTKKLSEDQKEARSEKMKGAVKAAKDAVSMLFRQVESSMEKSDTDDSEKGWSSEEELPAINGVTECEAHWFVENLPNHLLFTTSFDVDGTDTSESKLCLCPCSQKKSGQWLKMFNLPNSGSGEACHKTFEHSALLAHLDSKGDVRDFRGVDLLHFGTRAYLIKLYSNHYPLGLDHEALYVNKKHNLYKQVMAYKHRLREK
jgi:hypothetical protein